MIAILGIPGEPMHTFVYCPLTELSISLGYPKAVWEY